MMRIALILLGGLLLLAGCRREDWRETSFVMPEQVPFGRLRAELLALDRETPPEVSLAKGVVRVRYNSMRVSLRNLTYVRDELIAEESKGQAE